jgi:hypothetical protein
MVLLLNRQGAGGFSPNPAPPGESAADFTGGRGGEPGNSRKPLIEHPKLYLFFTKIHFVRGKVPSPCQSVAVTQVHALRAGPSLSTEFDGTLVCLLVVHNGPFLAGASVRRPLPTNRRRPLA